LDFLAFFFLVESFHHCSLNFFLIELAAELPSELLLLEDARDVRVLVLRKQLQISIIDLLQS